MTHHLSDPCQVGKIWSRPCDWTQRRGTASWPRGMASRVCNLPLPHGKCIFFNYGWRRCNCNVTHECMLCLAWVSPFQFPMSTFSTELWGARALDYAFLCFSRFWRSCNNPCSAWLEAWLDNVLIYVLPLKISRQKVKGACKPKETFKHQLRKWVEEKASFNPRQAEVLMRTPFRWMLIIFIHTELLKTVPYLEFHCEGHSEAWQASRTHNLQHTLHLQRAYVTDVGTGPTCFRIKTYDICIWLHM